ncbi:MAG TPA: carboxypeptidase-like regulatory domain-containing protein [Anaeromyxobacter sp.]|nr:carboxypeptidase-like regulatory domain-containing protein [Anaeromyxobacter sp.]
MTTLLLACGGGGGGTNSTLVLDPLSADVTAGGQPLTIHAVVTGDISSVEWSCDPSNVGTLVPGGLQATYTPPDRVSANTAVTVTARGNGKTASAVLTVKPAPPAIVSGHVVAGIGRPMPGATVMVASQPDLTATADDDGAFVLEGVVPPYDVVAVAPDSADPGHIHATYYPSLHRLDPTLSVNVPYGALGGGTIAGYLSGPGYPQPEGQRTYLGAAGPGAGTNSSFSVYDTGEYRSGTGDFQFCLGPAVHADIYALQAQLGTDGKPELYTAAGASPDGVDLVNGTMASDDFALTGISPADTRLLTGSLTKAGEAIATDHMVRVLARFGLVPLDLIDESTTAMAYKVPAIADAIELYAYDLSNGSTAAFRRIAPADLGTGEVDLSIPGPPVLASPENGATGIDLATQAFTWQEMSLEPRVFVLSFRIGTAFALDYLTAARTLEVQLPDPTPFGLAYPKNTWFSWHVFGTTAVGTVEEAADPDAWLAIMHPNEEEPLAFTQYWYPASNAYVSARTPPWSFQTAP